ncbi:tetratricopeptide repeat-containing protein [Besnoitia besnoiti]|uniref:Tetratricopeptide repeat-containing protein n=1 Tax=Besnoitia besnoiti TaxID=94643 RepID=A0A2A9M5R4_BESBE|nr:tetratricopeptide repeat-containing protein [Besnoitia besnoiti]PFH31651.1 tetratricopeptide repeat-containing protein [Besnoitia besnoiti]
MESPQQTPPAGEHEAAAADVQMEEARPQSSAAQPAETQPGEGAQSPQREKALQIASLKDFCCAGVDFGAQNSVLASAALAMPLAVDVEGNALANRSTPSTEAFDGKLRLVGEEAEARATSNLKNTISHLPLWIRVKDHASLEALKTRFAFSAFPAVSFDTARREPVFEVLFDDETVQVPLTLVVSHYLKTLVSFAGTSRGQPVATNALAIALPASFSLEDFRLVREACDLAGFSRLVVSEAKDELEAAETDAAGPLLLTRADALLNCWSGKHLPQVYAELPSVRMPTGANGDAVESGAADEEVKFIALVDVGFAETNVQVAELRPRKEVAAAEMNGEKTHKIQNEIALKRLALAVDNQLGTVDAINLLASHVTGVVKTKHGDDVVTHSKRALRLFAGCQRVVKDLSGLPDTTLALEGFLQDEVDLTLPVSRDLFEKLCAPLKERLAALVASAFASAGVAPAQVAGMDLVGGGSRIPWVAETLAAALSQGGSEEAAQRLRRTLDGSSSVAVGAVFAAEGRRYVAPVAVGGERAVEASLEALASRLALTEAQELARRAVRNSMESYLFQMQGALCGPHRALFSEADRTAITALLRENEDWLLDHPEAAQREFEEKFESLKAELQQRCAAYFAAVEQEKAAKEKELEEAARAAAVNAQGEDLDVKLPNSQCLKRAKKNKDEGNELFKDGNTEMAVQRYIKAVQYTAKLFDLSPQDKAEADALKLACNLNLAQAYLKLSASADTKVPLTSTQETFLKKAISCCDAALETDATNLKAAYRRALANEKLRDFDAAMADVQKGLAASPADADLLKLKDRLDRQMKVQKEKAKKLYAKMFS